MKAKVFKAKTRGHKNYGWLDANYSFNFGGFYNPERTNFGVLRVLNDDTIAPGKGFDTHPHDNMEIITIPLRGDLAHKDSIGNSEVIREGEIQVMSAGSGIYHSEFNPNDDREVNLFQIWLFPNKRDVTPRYDQIAIKTLEKENELFQILSPDRDDKGVWIHQDAWFYMGKFSEGHIEEYQLNQRGNGVYIMIIDGEIEIEGHNLGKRDAIGIEETDNITIKAQSKSKILLMEVPMALSYE